jgi:hypothetical protein
VKSWCERAAGARTIIAPAARRLRFARTAERGRWATFKGRSRMKRFHALLPLLLCIAACSTTPITEQSGKPVPSDRIYLPEFTVQSAERTAKVSFLRDSGILGVACTDKVLVNGRPVFAIRAGEYQSLFLPPGQYFFGLETGGGACPDVATSQNTTLTNGAEETYRILRPSDFALRLTRIK